MPAAASAGGGVIRTDNEIGAKDIEKIWIQLLYANDKISPARPF